LRSDEIATKEDTVELGSGIQPAAPRARSVLRVAVYRFGDLLEGEAVALLPAPIPVNGRPRDERPALAVVLEAR
jgi:hypothetical protein